MQMMVVNMMDGLATWAMLTLAQAMPATAPAAVGDGVVSLQIHSVWDWIKKGGPTMIPIGLCSLVALALIGERMLSLRRRRVIPRSFVAKLQSVASDRATALELAKANGSPIANVLTVALRWAGAPIEHLRKSVEEAGMRELVDLRKHMRVLSVLPQVSTMLGLLGTVFGMIHTFQAVSFSGQALGKTEMLAKGIYEAWTCTAAGLLIAIPVLIAYHVLMGKIDALAAEMDRVTEDWMERFSGSAGFAPPPADLLRPGGNGPLQAAPASVLAGQDT